MRETTPGPWIIDPDEPHWPSIRIKAMQGPIDVCPAQVYSLPDAYLISAAPDMYTALELVIGSLAFDREDPFSREVMKRITAAIAKARGESS